MGQTFTSSKNIALIGVATLSIGFIALNPSTSQAITPDPLIINQDQLDSSYVYIHGAPAELSSNLTPSILPPLIDYSGDWVSP